MLILGRKVQWTGRRASCFSADVAHLPRLAAVFLVSALAACGGKSFEDDPDPNRGGSEQGGSSTGGSGPAAGTAHGGAISKGGTASAGSGQGGSAGSVCETFDDDPGSFINVAIYNNTATPIYLGQTMVTCGVSPLFQVHDAGGAALPSLGNCRSPCQSLRNMGPAGCPAICAFPSSVSLQPGGVLYTSWDGLFQVQTQLPEQCVAPGYGEGSCDQAQQIEPGTFTFSALAGLSVDCAQTTGGTCSPCTPDGNGGCTTPGSVIGGKLLTAVTSVLLDGAYGIYGSAPPAPVPARPGDPGGAPGAIAPAPTVELVFSD
jgi:hypothetical protein